MKQPTGPDVSRSLEAGSHRSRCGPSLAVFVVRHTQLETDVLTPRFGQIELIQQTNDANSPYSYFFRDSDDAQVLQQIAYMVANVDEAILQCEARGMHEVGRILPAPELAYVYMSSPAMQGIAIELMPHDQGFLDEYARCAAEAAEWDGSDPYRLISF